ncbi:15699_t:CDS:2 [Acaulospora morrowiae]|uniref:15699_t:CDS:1 n=1 Tax=Acaulospora morrowiae TaxID=94023 RepID=A0A9N9EMD9_9GLOM|nr:15699_t:CDS:2 [Acaulospora morrowiae]
MSDNEYDEISQTESLHANESLCESESSQESICGKSFKYLPGWSTSNMNLHLADEHDLVEFQRENKNHTKALNSQKTIADMLHIASHKGIKKTKIHHAVVEWLIVNNFPLDTINGEGFRRFMLQIDSGFRRPSYKALKKEILFGNTNARNQIYELLKKSSEMVSLNTDLWMARNGTGYIGITAHWLSKEFELNEILLCLEPMPYSHTSQAIKEFLIQKVQDFNLQDKILCVITDNGSNMVAAIRDWDSVERLPCTAHILQLSVNHALKKTTNKFTEFENWLSFLTHPNKAKDLSENELVIAIESQPNTQSLDNQENQLESDPESIIKEIQTIIYNSLFEYWDRPSKICLLATLLDPRLKEMSFASDEIRNDTIRECREQLHQLTQPPTEEHTTSSNSTTLSFNNMFANVIFGTQISSSLDELDYYLNFRQTPVAFHNSDPLL